MLHRRATWLVLAVVSVAILHLANTPELSAQAASARDAERDFLSWKIEDAARALAKLHVCAQKHVPQELASLCKDAADERNTETEIAARYLDFLYGEKSPSVRADSKSLSSLEGAKFETRFLKQMIQQDHDGVARARTCLAKSGRPEIQNFCHLVERSRSPEIMLLENQLCMLHNCRGKLSQP